MNLVRRLCILLAAGTGAALTQPAAKLGFEVVSVKAAMPPKTGPVFHGCRGGPGSLDRTLWTCQNLSLTTLIAQAYDIEEDQLVAPDWTRSEMFDVSARVPLQTSAPEFATLQQNLLTDRFRLIVHRETKSVKMYDLVVATGGAKLQVARPNSAEPATAPALRPNLRAVDANGFPLADTPGFVSMAGHAKYYKPSLTMRGLAEMLKSHLGAPVRDATGLTGSYEIRLLWVGEESKQSASAGPNSGANLRQALQEQLGLRAVAKDGEIQVLIVDRLDKTPTEN